MLKACSSHEGFFRVALARAVYAPARYVLLDDPLSAVVRVLGRKIGTTSDPGPQQDSHTARFLLEKLFCGPLLANRTVVRF